MSDNESALDVPIPSLPPEMIPHSVEGTNSSPSKIRIEY